MIPTSQSLRSRITGLFSAGTGKAEIVPLQFLRGIAASGVVFEHLLERYARRGALPAELPDFISRMGQTGVAVFFAISGFIMVHIALRSGTRRLRPFDFLRSRFLRVAPLYYLTTVLIVVFTLATQSMSTRTADAMPGATAFILSFLFIPYRGANGLIQPVYGLGWTLQYEMFFYLLFAAGLAWGIRRGVWAVLAVLAILVAAGIGMAEPGERWGTALLAYVYTRPILLYFAAGILIALLRHRVERHLPCLPFSIMALAAMAALLVAIMSGGIIVPLLAASVALGITVLISAAPPSGGPSLAFSRLSRAFGDASYSIYLTHSFLLGAFAAVTARFVGHGYAALTIAALAGCLMCAVAGWLTWRFVELPIDARLRRKRSHVLTTPAAMAEAAPADRPQ